MSLDRRKIKVILMDGEWHYAHEIYNGIPSVDNNILYNLLQDMVDEGVLEYDNTELIKYRRMKK